jgi:hypothetical protein
LYPSPCFLLFKKKKWKFIFSFFEIPDLYLCIDVIDILYNPPLSCETSSYNF